MVNQSEHVVSSFYLAYYGRPADPAGLAFWTQQLERAGGDFSQIVAAFSSSEESLWRFGNATPAERLGQIYRELFERAPDPAGLAFWTDAVEKGAVSLGQAATAVLQGAQGSDKQLTEKRLAVAEQFTAAVSAGQSGYNGTAALEAGRLLLQAVTPATTSAETQAMIDASVRLSAVASKSPAVIDALSVNGSLDTLLASARAATDPVAFVQVLAKTAELAQDNKVVLETLLRGGGMENVLKSLPASATLGEVVTALDHGGAAAAAELVYPTAPVQPVFQVSVVDGVVYVSGTGTGPVDVDLTHNTITRNGVTVALQGNPDLTAISAKGYAGKVMLHGTVSELLAAVGPDRGIAGYTVADVKAALFDGAPGSVSFKSPEVQTLLNGAAGLQLADRLRADELSLLSRLDKFDVSTLDAVVDTTPPVTGTLSFGDLVITGVGSAAGVTNDDSFTLNLNGTEQGANVVYQVSQNGTDGWTTVASTSGLESGHWYFRARVADAAGNLAFSNTIDVEIDKVAPVVTGIAYGANDGKLAIGETVTLSVTFSKPVSAVGASLALNSGGTAVYSSGNGSNTLVFTYTPQAGENTADLATAITNALAGQIRDQVGNAFVASGLNNQNPGGIVLVDGVAPTQTLHINTISQDVGDSPDTAADFTTNVANANVGATLSAGLGEDESVQYSIDGGAHWSSAGVSVTGEHVTISGVDVSASPTLQLRVKDAAGNVGPVAQQAVTFDNVAPAKTIVVSGLQQDVGDSPDVSIDYTTNVASAAVGAPLSAALSAGEYVQYSVDGGTTWTSANLTVTGTSVVITGIDTTNSPTVSVRVVDAAGNATAAQSQSIVYHNVAPTQVVSFTTVSQDGGNSPDTTDNFVTNVASATVTAHLSAALAATDYVQYSVDGGSTWTSTNLNVAGQTITISGINTTTSPTVAVRLVDASGNASTPVTQAITYDNVAPAQTVSFTTVSQDGLDSPDTTDNFVTNVASATVTAHLSAALAATDYVQYSVDGGATWANASVSGQTITISGIDTTASRTVAVRLVDAAGNASTPVTQAITYDNVAPTVVTTTATVTEDSGESADNVTDLTTNVGDATLTLGLSSMVGDGDYVQYSVDGGAHWSLPGAANINVSGTTATISHLDTTGSPTVSVRVVDAAGNAGAISNYAVTYDGTAPTTTLAFTSVDEDKLADSPDVVPDATTNRMAADVKFALSSALGAGEYVQYSIDSGATWSTTSSPTLSVSGTEVTINVYVASSPTILVRVVDAAGNPGATLSQQIVYDGTPPNIVVTLDSISQDRGASPDVADDFTTNISSVTATGTLSAPLGTHDYMQYSVDGVHWFTSGFTLTGLTYTVTNVDMSHSPYLMVRVVDGAGNPGIEAMRTITLDTVAPTVTAIAATVTQDTGDSADNVNDLTTNVASASVGVTLSAALAAGDYVQYSVDGGATWSAPTAANVHVMGTHVNITGIDTTTSPTVSVRVVDAAGNEGAVSNYAITYDNVAPTTTLAFASVSEDALADSPDAHADAITNQSTVALRTTLSAALVTGEYVQYSLDGGAHWTVAGDASVNVSGTTVTISGLNAAVSPTVQVRVVDAAGNPGSVLSQHIVYDNVAPATTVTLTGLTEDAGDSPDASANFTTNVGTVTVNGTLSAALIGDDYVQYSVDGGAHWSTIGVSVSGTALMIANLTAATSPTLQVRVVDGAGNPGTAASQAITYDNVAPTETVTIDSVSQDSLDSPDISPDFTTNVASAAISATLSSALTGGAYVQYSTDGTHWSAPGAANVTVTGTAVVISGVDVSASPTVQVRVVDAAGNAGTATHQTVSFDATAPATTLGFKSVAADGDSNPPDATGTTTALSAGTLRATLSAALAAGDYVQYSLDGATWSLPGASEVTVTGSTVAIAGVNFSTNPTVSVRVVDGAGNPGAVLATPIRFLDNPPTTTVVLNGAQGDAGDSPDVQLDFVTNLSRGWVSGRLSAPLQADEHVEYSLDGAIWLTADVSVSGNLFRISNVDFASQPSLSVRVVNSAGSTGPATAQAFTYDRSAPDVTVVLDTVSEAPSDLVHDFHTAQSTVTVTGTLSAPLAPGDYVQFRLNTGPWSAPNDPGVIVTDRHVELRDVDVSASPALQIRVVDAAGNAGSSASTPITFDMTPPAIGTFGFVAVTQGAGDAVADNVTREPIVTARFSYSGSAPAADEYVQYSLDGMHWSSSNLTVDAAGHAVDISGIDLRGGVDSAGNKLTTVALRAIDLAGNIAGNTSFSLVYDQQADAPRFQLSNDTFGAGTAGTGSDNITTIGTYTVVGEAGAVIEYSADGISGWSTTAPVATEGSNHFYARQTDPAGNQSAAVAVSFTLDSTAPATPGLVLHADTGVSSSDKITSDGRIDLSGLAGDGATVWEYSTDGGTHWSQGGAAASTTATLDLGGHADGTINLRVRQVDVAGNVSPIAALDFTLDTSAPMVSGLAFRSVEAPGADSHTSLASIPKVRFQYTALAADAVLQSRIDGGDWTDVSNSAIDRNTHTITLDPVDTRAGSPTVWLRALDQAGNVADMLSEQISGPPIGGSELAFIPTADGLLVYSPFGGQIYVDDGVEPVRLWARGHVDAFAGTFFLDGESIGAGTMSVGSGMAAVVDHTGSNVSVAGRGGYNFGYGYLVGSDGDDTFVSFANYFTAIPAGGHDILLFDIDSSYAKPPIYDPNANDRGNGDDVGTGTVYGFDPAQDILQVTIRDTTEFNGITGVAMGGGQPGASPYTAGAFARNVILIDGNGDGLYDEFALNVVAPTVPLTPAVVGAAISFVVQGTDGADTLIGGIGNDTLNGGTGDYLDGRAGNDIFRVAGNAAVRGGAGADQMFLDYGFSGRLLYAPGDSHAVASGAPFAAMDAVQNAATASLDIRVDGLTVLDLRSVVQSAPVDLSTTDGLLLSTLDAAYRACAFANPGEAHAMLYTLNDMTAQYLVINTDGQDGIGVNDLVIRCVGLPASVAVVAGAVHFTGV